MSEEIVLHERRGPALWITLNRPEKRNAINNDVILGISRGIAAALADPEVRCIVLTGAGEKAFCAGGDLQPGGGFNFDFAQPRSPYGNLIRQAQDCPLPILAVINGVCVAGGMGLLAMVDMAVSVDTAKFGLPEAKIGLFPMQVLALMKNCLGKILSQSSLVVSRTRPSNKNEDQARQCHARQDQAEQSSQTCRDQAQQDQARAEE